jgi:hypothetical protein
MGFPVQPLKILRWYASSKSSANMMSQVSSRAERAEMEKYQTPQGVLILVGDAGVQDEAPEGVGSFVDGAHGVNEKLEWAVVGHHFNYALPYPSSKLGTEGDLGCLVTVPASVVRPTRRAKREPGLWHD